MLDDISTAPLEVLVIPSDAGQIAFLSKLHCRHLVACSLAVRKNRVAVTPGEGSVTGGGGQALAAGVAIVAKGSYALLHAKILRETTDTGAVVYLQLPAETPPHSLVVTSICEEPERMSWLKPPRFAYRVYLMNVLGRSYGVRALQPDCGLAAMLSCTFREAALALAHGLDWLSTESSRYANVTGIEGLSLLILTLAVLHFSFITRRHSPFSFCIEDGAKD